MVDKSITLNGKTLDLIIIPEAGEVRKEHENITRYKKPIKNKYQDKKEQSSAVKHFTKDEIIKNYGLKAMGNMTRIEQLLYALKEHAPHNKKEALQLSEMFTRAGFKIDPKSHSSAMSYIWRQFGDPGLKYIGREKRGRAFVYYKTSNDMSTKSLDELVAIFSYGKRQPPITAQEAKKENSPGAPTTSAVSETTAYNEVVPSDVAVRVEVAVDMKVRFGLLEN